MLFVVCILALLSISRGDVSHLDTDLRDDGYHYKQPQKPFLPGKNDIYDQLGPDVSQPGPSIRTQPTKITSARPTAEYLPPDVNQQTYQPPSAPKLPTQPTPAKEYGPPSTFLPQTPAEPTKEYGPPATFIPQTPPSNYPRPNGKTPEQNGPSITVLSQTRRPQLKPSTFATVPKLPSTPEREYLPPDNNEISAEQKPKDIFPGTEGTLSPKFPVQQPTLSVLKPTTPQFPVKPKQTVTYQTPNLDYPGPEASIRPPQPTYTPPQSTYSAPQPTYPLPQSSSTFETGPQLTGSQPTRPQPTRLQPARPNYEESEPAHELGPDGYKYKVPANKFKF